MLARNVLASLEIADPPAAWEALGISIRNGASAIGQTRLTFTGADSEPARGIVGWTLRQPVRAGAAVDGLATAISTQAPPRKAFKHPLGATALDHIVVSTPDLGRTCGALADCELKLRRTRDVPGSEPAMRQAFFRLGEVVLELLGPVEATGDGPASFWGLVLVVPDLDAAAAALGERLGTIRDAVQPGRRIVTVRREAGLGTAVAMMTPQPPR